MSEFVFDGTAHEWLPTDGPHHEIGQLHIDTKPASQGYVRVAVTEQDTWVLLGQVVTGHLMLEAGGFHCPLCENNYRMQLALIENALHLRFN